MNKGDLMSLVYSKEQLRNVDSAIPKELWSGIDTSAYVMDYNKSGNGILENLYKRLIKKYSIGQIYRYSEIPQEANKFMECNEYGQELLGKNAIHLRIHEYQIDIWFIWIAQANEGILKCVYNE